jgi:hypothetical protein
LLRRNPIPANPSQLKLVRAKEILRANFLCDVFKNAVTPTRAADGGGLLKNYVPF